MTLTAALILIAPSIAYAMGFVEADVNVVRTHVGVPGDNFGWVGADLGDLDGDGVDDYGVTAITDPTGGPLAGRAYVFSGSDGSMLNAIYGAAGELMGYSMASAGDVDADGTPDYIVGAPGFAAVTPTPLGRALVLSGADHSLIHEFTPAVLTRMGTAVSGAGDVNGDGHDDLIVGSQSASVSKALAGQVTVFSGADGSELWSRNGTHAWDLLGSAVDVIGDVTGDGVPDQVAGAYGATGRDGGAGGSGRGEAYVLSGVDGSIVHTLKPTGDAENFARFFARRAGDVDGDGTPDVFVADYGSGRGGPGGTSATPGAGTPINGTGAFYVFSGATGQRILIEKGAVFGEGLGPGRAIADVDGDGTPDLVVAAYTSSEGAPSAGTVRIYSGADTTVLRTITSTTPGEFLGIDALAVGDVDGDGRADYLLTGFGVAYVVSGNASG
ncbi:MAG: FG-GAP-like repeat-containing protein [Acidimicrobiia bacterium]|nr:FG-GAP-like repeat-containing protein [Acidimicrobiia bacterium]